MNQQSKLEFNSLDLFGFLWRNRKILIIIGFIAAIVSSIISLLIEEKYESVVTLYPAKSSSVTFNEVTNEDQSVSKFGEEEEAEQMLQILESSFIRNKIISKYQLIKHYKINESDEFANTELQETYSENIHFERNKNGAVLIKVLDENPDTAANIANDIAQLFDTTKSAMIRERATIDYNIKKIKLDKLKSELQEIRDTMSKLTSIGVVTQDAYQALTEAMINVSDSEMKLDYINKINKTEKYGSILTSFQVEAKFMAERIASMQTSFEQAEADAHSSISHKFIVDIAYPSEKKAYPIRWLIVVISTLSTLLFAIILLLFKEKLKELKAA